MEALKSILEQLQKTIEQEEKIIFDEISKIENHEKRNNLLLLYNEMKKSDNPQSFIPELISQLNDANKNNK